MELLEQAVELKNQGNLDQAEEAFARVLSTDPENHFALSNLGNLLAMQHRYEEALGCYKAALNNTPNKQNIISNITNIFYMMGDFDKAIPYYKKILSSEFNELIFMYNYISALFSAGKIDEVCTEIDWLIYEKNLTPEQAGFLHVRRGIIEYLKGDIDKVKELLEKSGTIPPDAPDAPALKAFKVFFQRLIEYWEENPDKFQQKAEKSIFLLGDSHILSAAHAKVGDYNCVPLLNQGCKAWHLAANFRNQFKSAFEILVKNIPDGSTVIISTGEIDCRHNGGIFSNHKRNPQNDLETDIRNLVNGYVDYVLNVAEHKNLKVMFCGVPACSADLSGISESDKETVLKIIDQYNLALKGRAAEEGAMFIDLHSVGTEGHIDDYHLKPEVFIDQIQKCLGSLG